MPQPSTSEGCSPSSQKKMLFKTDEGYTYHMNVNAIKMKEDVIWVDIKIVI